MPPPRLLQDGACTRVDLTVLEEEIRAGAAPRAARLHHPPWTGEAFLPLGEVAALTEAFDAPSARLVARLRTRCMPWAAWALTTVVGLFGLVQVLAIAGVFPDAVLRVFDAGRVGYDELFLGAAWWSPWLSQLTHGGAWHLAANLVVVAVMALRVERALGAAALLVVAAASVSTGTLAIAWLDDLPAVGSSVLAYGLWGAVLAIGFRFGDALQQESVRGRYGFGTLPLFAVLFAASLGQPAVTHVGHLFGLLGGVAATMVLSAETLAPRARARAVARRNMALALLLALVPVGVQALVGATPVLLAGRTVPVEVAGVGARLELPARMARHEVRLVGMPAWTTSAVGEAPLFVGLARLRDGVALEDALAEQWADAMGLDVTAHADPDCPAHWAARGGRCIRLQVADPDTGELRDRVVEHVVRRGQTVLRAGWRAGTARPEPRRERLYRHLLAGLTWGDPPAVQEARERLARNPLSPRMRYELARELSRLVTAPVDADAALWHEADGLLAELAEREDAWAWDAARLRLRMWSRAVEVTGRDFQAAAASGAAGGLDLAGARAWAGDWLARAPVLDTGIHRPGVEFLARSGDCTGAWGHLADLGARGGGEAVAQELTPVVAGSCW